MYRRVIQSPFHVPSRKGFDKSHDRAYSGFKREKRAPGIWSRLILHQQEACKHIPSCLESESFITLLSAKIYLPTPAHSIGKSSQICGQGRDREEGRSS